jgi:hypothetical protein|tara:strand:- start:1735 stop:2139 length:405 start_codon:yes stop_codon:yes gene_type:complete
MLYFAYGSNLNKAQMARRCPQAKPLGAAYFVGWRLVFRGVADIEPAPVTEMLPVGIWEITPKCLQALDVYEGVSGGLYRRVHINGILTYRMNSSGYSRPSQGYLESIEQGYRDFGLDASELYHARDWEEFEEIA